MQGGWGSWRGGTGLRILMGRRGLRNEGMRAEGYGEQMWAVAMEKKHEDVCLRAKCVRAR